MFQLIIGIGVTTINHIDGNKQNEKSVMQKAVPMLKKENRSLLLRYFVTSELRQPIERNMPLRSPKHLYSWRNITYGVQKLSYNAWIPWDSLEQLECGHET